MNHIIQVRDLVEMLMRMPQDAKAMAVDEQGEMPIIEARYTPGQDGRVVSIEVEGNRDAINDLKEELQIAERDLADAKTLIDRFDTIMLQGRNEDELKELHADVKEFLEG